MLELCLVCKRKGELQKMLASELFNDQWIYIPVAISAASFITSLSSALVWIPARLRVLL
jgi:hypothetical protein